MSGLFGLGRKKAENEAESATGTGSGTGTGTALGSGNTQTGVARPPFILAFFSAWESAFAATDQL